MKYWDQKLIREQLDKKLAPMSSMLNINLSNGWIKILREAFGMTTTQLARKIGVNQSRVFQIEKSEVKGNLKLSTMEKIADGLDMKFVYSFIPKTSLETMVRNQAEKLALKRMEQLDHTMRLEQQGLDEKEIKKALETMIDRILIEGDKQLWDL